MKPTLPSSKKEKEKGRKEGPGRKGGRGEQKVIGGAQNGILPLCAATMDSRVHVHVSPFGWI